jgi:hypothetical protein
MVLNDFPLLIKKVEANSFIPHDIRQVGLNVMKQEFGDITFRVGMISSSQGRSESAYQMFKLLNNFYQAKSKARVLGAATRLSRIAPLRWGLAKGYELWSNRHRFKRPTTNNQEYAKLATYLRLEE